MAKSTPRSATKTAAPSSAAKSAAKGTPSSSKKRVRVEDEPTAQPTPTASAKKAKGSAKGKAAAVAEAGSEETPSKKGKNGVVLQDLRGKKLEDIEPIHSKDAPAPAKGALKSAKGKGKAAAPPAAEEEEEEITLEVEASGDEDEEEELLEGFEDGSEDGADSSDEEMDEQDEQEKKKKTEQLLKQLPKVKGGDKAVEKKVQEKKEKKAPVPGVIYLGRIPKGFYEEEMKSYFSQFGEVTRLRLSRNKQTGASKHYAFLEFKYASVAQIVHETMDNYLLAGHILVCKVIPNDQVHPKLWVGANRKFRVVPKARKEQKRRDAPKTDAQKATASARLLSREEKKRAQLAKLGIEYEFSGFAGKKVEGDEPEEEKTEEKGTPAKAKGKKGGRKSAGGEEPAKKKPRKSNFTGRRELDQMAEDEAEKYVAPTTWYGKIWAWLM
ncbi:nucleolar protein [Rhodosporidiobolus nylandii]